MGTPKSIDDLPAEYYPFANHIMLFCNKIQEPNTPLQDLVDLLLLAYDYGKNQGIKDCIYVTESALTVQPSRDALLRAFNQLLKCNQQDMEKGI